MIAGFSLARKQPNKIEMKHLLLTTIAQTFTTPVIESALQLTETV